MSFLLALRGVPVESFRIESRLDRMSLVTGTLWIETWHAV
jgi:hypothetical protein